MDVLGNHGNRRVQEHGNHGDVWGNHGDGVRVTTATHVCRLRVTTATGMCLTRVTAATHVCRMSVTTATRGRGNHGDRRVRDGVTTATAYSQGNHGNGSG